MYDKITIMIWIKAALIRALKTFGQTTIAMLPAMAKIDSVNWKTVLSTAAFAFVASLITSLAGLPEVKYKAQETEEGENDEH